ncbi:MAG TPA: hypothetical protein VLF90_00410 [Patescibacteria group bacterium]|nr:hypothetical protein [Patescibacteria group bacterium]
MNKNGLLKRITNIGLALSLVISVGLMAVTPGASAAQITGRALTLGSSVASASTTYTFTFTLPSATVLQSFEAVACTTASGSCSTPSGFSSSSSTLPSQPTNLGDASGWTVNTSTSGKLRLKKTGNSAAPTGSQTVVWGAVTNPSATNATFFMRLTSYSDDAWTTAVDTGTVASSTAGQITVTASVDETLTFTLSSATVALGSLTTSTTGSGTSTMSAATNAASGYAITVNGTTLTSGSNTITALASQTASTQGNSQFGINLKANTTPSVGSNVSGGGSGTATSNYNTADQFRFVSGDSVASASAPTNSNTYTVSYIANIAGATLPGSYTTTLTYIATATF